MQVQISTQENSVIIGKVEYPKNILCFELYSKNEVAIKRASDGATIVGHQHYSGYKNASGVPYASVATLVTDLRTALFK